MRHSEKLCNYFSSVKLFYILRRFTIMLVAQQKNPRYASEDFFIPVLHIYTIVYPSLRITSIHARAL